MTLLVTVSLLLIVVSSQCGPWTAINPDDGSYVTLDLEPLNGVVLHMVDNYEPSPHHYIYSICANNETCKGNNVMAKYTISNDPGTCFIIGRWDFSKQPTYQNINGGTWRFVYDNGDYDCGNPARTWSPKFVCNPAVDYQSGNVSTIPNSCFYEVEIQTRYACPSWTTTTSVPGGFTGLALKTDQYPTETSWTLRTRSGILVDSRYAGYYTELNHKYMDPFPDLSDQEYVFEIMDSAGDGICCNYGEGYYNIWVNDVVIYYGNGDFGISASTTFNVTGLYCQWTRENNILDLRSLSSSDVTITGVDDNNSSLVFAYTPCRNGLVCNSVHTMANLVDIATLHCQSYLAVWNNDTDTVEPSYDADNKVWEFIYQNGESCNNELPSEFFVYWHCDDSIPEFKVMSAGLLAPCLYKLEIASNLACTEENSNNSNVYREYEMDGDKNISSMVEQNQKLKQQKKKRKTNNSHVLNMNV